ncbi:MAG TPA: terminase small subunit, partial [Burkholderiales bacterium]
MEASTHKPLTDRQERFVFEYLIDQNASAAAQRAGYSARSRASQANVLMNDPAVRERIRGEMRGLLAELRLSALDLMKERMRAGFFRAGKLFDASGRLLGFEEMEAEVRDALIIGGKWRKGVEEVRFRMPNREPALRALERVHERLDRLDEAHYAALEKER